MLPVRGGLRGWVTGYLLPYRKTSRALDAGSTRFIVCLTCKQWHTVIECSRTIEVMILLYKLWYSRCIGSL